MQHDETESVAEPHLIQFNVYYQLQSHQDRFLSTSVFQVVLSVFWRKGMLGAAYYTAETSEV